MLLSAPVYGDNLAFYNKLESLDVISPDCGIITDIKDTYTDRAGSGMIDLLSMEISSQEPYEDKKVNTSDFFRLLTSEESVTESRIELSTEYENIEYSEPAIGLDSTHTGAVPVLLSASGKGTGERAPVNKEFLSFLERLRSGEKDLEGDYPLGYIPSPVDLSHNTGKEISVFNMQKGATDTRYTLPQTYLVSAIASEKSDSVASTGSGLDLRADGKVSDVKNQEQCGSCWAFSTYSSLESTLLPSESWDFSENNMKNTHGYDFSPCKGGNSLMSTAYLARWDGPIAESSDPYSTVSSSSPANVQELKHIQEVWYIPSRSGPLDNENIKMALTEQGAIYSTIYWNEAYFSGYHNSYYYGGSATGNHAVTIVGWDDSYDRTNFERLPSGNGAFIVKNSWGPEWGDDGYFYVSYYDTGIGRDNALFMAETAENYDNIYQYDPLGWVVSYGSGSDTEYFANIFTSTGSEQLSAVSFYTPVPDASFQVWVYLDTHTNPTAGTNAGSISGTASLPGYHTVSLNSPISLNSGQKFSVVVKITTPGYQYPVAMEYPYSGFSSRATARSGESFVSSNGNSWTDVTTVYPDTNVCLKAFTKDGGAVQTIIPTPTPTPVHTTTPTVTPTPAPTPEGDTTSPSVTLLAPGSYMTVTRGSAVTIQWSSSDNVGIAGVSVEYSTDGKASWNPVRENLGESGSVDWMVPDTASSGVAYIRVTAVDTSGNTASDIRSIIIRTGSAEILSSFSSLKDTDQYGWIDPSSADGSAGNSSTALRIQNLPNSGAIISDKINGASDYPLSLYSRISTDGNQGKSISDQLPESRIPSSVLSRWKKE
jgi:C1A family cysteine protease